MGISRIQRGLIRHRNSRRRQARNGPASAAPYVGYYGIGVLRITNGGAVSNPSGFIGYYNGSCGTVTIDGAGSSWTNGSDLYVGYYGSGALHISNGGTVSGSSYEYIGYYSGSSGTATIDGNGSTWTSAAGLYVGGSGSGTINIINGGNIHNTFTYIGLGNGSSGTATIDGNGSEWTSNNYLNVGYSGTGALHITNGGIVSNNDGYIGHLNGSSGTATVDGSDSKWTNRGGLYVGYSGSGALHVSGGGTVSCSSYEYIGYYNGSSGTATVDGPGSTWTNTSSLSVGDSGSAGLSITNGGIISNFYGYIGRYSGSSGTATVDGTGSTWTNSNKLYIGGSGTAILSLTGGGVITATGVSVNTRHSSPLTSVAAVCLRLPAAPARLLTTARFASSPGLAFRRQYCILTYCRQTFSGTGTFQAVGGTWSITAHTFTASSVVAGTASTAIAMDLASAQRTLVSDNGPGGTGWVVGASFPAVGTTTNITFTATAMGSATLGTLGSQLAANESALSGWMFATSNYTVSATNPIYLSLDVGPGYSSDDFNIWHFDGTTWTDYAPIDLTYDGTYASFTATGLSGYAVSAVPEPGTLVLLGAGLLGLLVYGGENGNNRKAMVMATISENQRSSVVGIVVEKPHQPERGRPARSVPSGRDARALKSCET